MGRRLRELDDSRESVRDRGSMHWGIDMSQRYDAEMLVCFLSRRSLHRLSSPAVRGNRARNLTCHGRGDGANSYFAGWVAALCVPDYGCLGHPHREVA